MSESEGWFLQLSSKGSSGEKDGRTESHLPLSKNGKCQMNQMEFKTSLYEAYC
jgi:hypothetical protein